MRSNYSPLTSHGVVKRERKPVAKTTKASKVQGKLVPGVGTVLKLVKAFVFVEDDKPTAMPRTRIAYDHDAREWQMRDMEDMGMILFFKSHIMPEHTQVEIVSVINTQTACYGEPS